MRRLPLLAAFAVVLATGALRAGADDATKDALTKLQGTWTLVAAEKAGTKAPEAEFKDSKLVFSGHKVSGKVLQHELEATVKLDVSKSPGQIVLTHGDDHALKGIYECEGDTLRLCMSHGDEAPADFATKEGENNVLLVFKKAAP